MEQNSKANRLHALDGLRGLAIILVFLSHINATFINRSNFIESYIFESGVLGVTFLFILSGFLMAYLYPQTQNKMAFLQKRYTRIFPLFLSMCTINFILSFMPTAQWYIVLGVLLSIAIFSHSIWVFIVKRYVLGNFTKIIFYAFIGIQILTGMFYLWIVSHPAVFYYQQLPLITRAFTNYFVNATLTFPIGKYVTMLDPVYWSLAAEVLFYILYPFICVPIISYMSNRNKGTKIVLLICLIPFFLSIYMVSQHILYLSLFRFQLFYYFVTGMTLGYVYRKTPDTISKMKHLFPKGFSFLSIIVFFGCIYLAHTLGQNNQTLEIWLEIFFALPFTFLVAVALSHDTALAKFFRSKMLVYIGTISYSLYLSHMLVLNTMIHVTHQPNSAITTFFYILLTFGISILLSSVLYFLLERPYFIRKYAEKKSGVFLYTPNRNIPILFGSISLGLLLLIFIIYQSNVNFFTLAQPENNAIVIPKNADPLISLSKNASVTMQFTAAYNNLGIMTLHLLHNSLPNKKFVPQQYTFQIKEKGAANWYSTSTFYITHPTDMLPVSYGFPVISNAAGKTYIVSLSQLVPSSSEYILLDNEKNSMDGVYFINKKTIITNPQQLITFLENKFLTVINTNEALKEIELALPFILFSLYVYSTSIRIIKLKSTKR
ncbi:MAG TPA: acyltransferase [Candidatus Saccharimonadales bacterium]|nr:acyltransferase [Candidatus Saccharimonadales bacterium]